MKLPFIKAGNEPLPEQAGLKEDKEKAILLMQLMAGFWLLAKGIGWKVWIKERLFPVVPVFDWLDYPSWMHYILFAASLILLLMLLLKPLNKHIVTCLLIIELLSCAADQNRWQPWEYQYIFTLFICIINHSNYQRLIGCIAFVMAATYFYSGLGKLNEGYLVLFWDNVFLKSLFKVSQNTIQQNNLIHYSGYLTAVIEMLVAAGLFFSKTRKLAAWLMIAMHLFILIAIGPLGINYNIIVWPWNILMVLFLYFIFIQKGTVLLNLQTVWPGWNKLILICWAVLPALNYVGLWDSYLSSRLYSGHLPQMAICLKDSAEIEKLKPYSSKTDLQNLCSGDVFVNLQTWAMTEMHVPPYPEMRVYKKIAAQWNEHYKNSNTVFVYYRTIKQNEAERLPGE